MHGWWPIHSFPLHPHRSPSASAALLPTLCCALLACLLLAWNLFISAHQRHVSTPRPPDKSPHLTPLQTFRTRPPRRPASFYPRLGLLRASSSSSSLVNLMLFLNPSRATTTASGRRFKRSTVSLVEPNRPSPFSSTPSVPYPTTGSINPVNLHPAPAATLVHLHGSSSSNLRYRPIELVPRTAAPTVVRLRAARGWGIAVVCPRRASHESLPLSSCAGAARARHFVLDPVDVGAVALNPANRRSTNPPKPGLAPRCNGSQSR